MVLEFCEIPVKKYLAMVREPLDVRHFGFALIFCRFSETGRTWTVGAHLPSAVGSVERHFRLAQPRTAAPWLEAGEHGHFVEEGTDCTALRLGNGAHVHGQLWRGRKRAKFGFLSTKYTFRIFSGASAAQNCCCIQRHHRMGVGTCAEGTRTGVKLEFT